MRENGKPYLDYMLYFEETPEDSIGSGRLLILGFNYKGFISEVVKSETGEVVFSRITGLRKGEYQQIIRSMMYRGEEARSRIKEIILGIPIHKDTQEVYIFGEVLKP